VLFFECLKFGVRAPFQWRGILLLQVLRAADTMPPCEKSVAARYGAKSQNRWTEWWTGMNSNPRIVQSLG
jgi:hypothetical protein